MKKTIKLNESEFYKLTKKILNEIILPDFFNEIKMLHNLHYRQRLNRTEEPKIVKMTDFGVHGADNVALAEMSNGCYIFINKKGRYKYEMGLNPKKLARPEIVAAFFNSMVNFPKYKEVVETYDNCKAKVLDINNNVYIIDTSTGRESSLNTTISHFCYNFSSFKPDDGIIKDANRIEKSQLVLKKREFSGDDEDVKPLKFRIKEELLKLKK